MISLIIFLQSGRQDPPEALLAVAHTPTSTSSPTITPTLAASPLDEPTGVFSPLDSAKPATTASPTDTPTPTIRTAPTPSATPAFTSTTTPVPTPRATEVVSSFSLRGFTNGRWLEQQDWRLASSIKRLGWIQDGVDETEAEAIQDFLYIAVTSRSVASTIVTLRWVQDGVDANEAEAIRWLNNIKGADVASSVASLDWIEDEIDAKEVKAIEYLSYIANDDPAIAQTLISMDWIHDGITDLDHQLLNELNYLTNKHLVQGLKIVGMQFLESVEPPDLSAVDALSDLSSFRAGAFVRVMSHPTILDGITDDLVPIVATLDGVAQTNLELIDVLLDPSKVLLERRIITLPLSGDVILDIIRTAPGAERSMDLLEHSVRGAEEFMETPFPTGHVALLYENAVTGSNAGTNFGTHIVVRPEYDIDDDSHDASFAPSNNAHEVAHYYWSGNADWVDEGAAEFMASAVDGMRTGRPIGVTNAPCGYARSIAELENLEVSRGDLEFRCNYSLGERLFVDLHRTLGGDSFRQGFRELYAMSAMEHDADDFRGTSVGIDDVRRAFGSGDGMASTVIARWYEGTEPYDLSRLDPSPVDPRLSSINGRIDEAYIIANRDGPAVAAFSSGEANGWVYLTLEYSYSLSSGSYEVPLEIVEYFEDGFEFGRRSRSIGAEARHIGGTSRYSVGQSPPLDWAPGRYLVYVYAGDRKVAEVEYEVTP